MADGDLRGFKLASAYVTVSLDETQLDADIADLDSKLDGIRAKAIRMGLDPAEVDAAIAEIQAKLEALRGQAGIGISQGDLDATIAGIQAKLTALGAEKVNIRIGTSGVPQTTAEMAGLAAVMKAIEANSGPLVAAISGLAAAEKDTGDQSETAASKVAAAGAAAAAAGAQAHSAGGWWGMLTKEVTLFGGALGNIHMVGVIPLWHILMDAILETSIMLIEATVALTAFGMAAAPAAEDIYTHIKSVDDVVHALGIDIPPVTGHLHALGQALAPQIVELYGGALNMLSNNGTVLARIVTKITTGFDDWMAKLDAFSAKQSHTDGLIASGGEVLAQLSHVLDNVGVALENLVKADPGTVHFLLDVMEGASKLLEIFTEIPTPILYTALAIHAALLWGGLLTSWAVKAATPFVNLGKSLYGAAAGMGVFGDSAKAAAAESKAAAAAQAEANSEGEKTGNIFTLLNKAGIWGWVGVGVAALGGLIYWMTTADSATKGFIANLGNGLAQLNPGQAILQIGTDIGQLDHQITTVVPHIQSLNEQTSHLQDVTGKSFEAFAKSVPESLASWGNLGNTFAKAGATIVGGAKSMVSWFGLVHASMDKASDSGAYTRSIANLTQDQDHLFDETGKLLRQGYTYTQSLALMGLAGVQASDKFDVMDQKVANLIKGYQDMSVRGGILANSVNAVTFASEQQSSKITDLTQGWTSFISMVTGGQSAFDTFETQLQGISAAADTMSKLGVSGGKAGLSLTTTGKTVQHVKSQIDGLTASSLQLNQTFGQGITDANQMMNALLIQASAAGLGAKGTRLLTQAGKDMVAQMLPMADGSSEATAQLYALAQEAGYHGPDAFSSLVTWVGKTQNAEQNLQQITSRLTVASADLSTDVQNLAQALNQSLNQAMSAAIFQASGGQKAFDQFATAVIGSKHGVSDLKGAATTLATELLNTIGNTTQAHREFDAFAIQLGLTKTQADQLWQSVVRLAEAESRIPAHVSSTITISEILAGAVVGGGNTPSTGGMRLTQRAKGGPIRTGSTRPGADDNLALLSRDEWVIQAPAVRKYGSRMFEDLNAMRYASGGQVGGVSAAAGPAPSFGAPVVNNFNLSFAGEKPTQEEWHAIQLKLAAAVGSAP